jgi:hypothetical protein
VIDGDCIPHIGGRGRQEQGSGEQQRSHYGDSEATRGFPNVAFLIMNAYGHYENLLNRALSDIAILYAPARGNMLPRNCAKPLAFSTPI